jgi:hypothetical protein
MYKRWPNMGDSDIYKVDIPPKQIYAEAYTREPVHYDKNQIELCPKCGAYLSGMKWIGEKMYTIRKKNIPDFLYVFGGTNYFVISEKALNILCENGIKGINGAEKVDKIFYRKVPIEQTFYILNLERLDCPIDHEHSNFVYFNEPNERKCNLCDPMGRLRYYNYGFCFKPDVEIEADIFHIYEMGMVIFLTKRFIEICEENNLTGLSCHKITEYEEDIFSAEEIVERNLSKSRKMMGWEV